MPSTPGTLNYPATADDADSLFRVANDLATTLSGSITATDHAITLADASAFPASGAITIDSEIVYYTSKSGNVLTIPSSPEGRGADGTTAAIHASGAAVEMRIIGRHHAILRDAVLALEAKVGSGAATPADGAVLGGTAAGVSAWLRSLYNVVAHGAVADGSTDDRAAIQATVDAASAAGGGDVLLPGPGTYAIASTVTLKDDVRLLLGQGATVKWTGAAAGTMFSGGATNPLQRAAVVGASVARIDPNGLAGVVFDLHSPQQGEFGGLEVLAGTATTIVCRVRADATNASGYNSTRNAVFNRFGPFQVNGACGKVLELDGQSTGVVTLNQFAAIEARDVRLVGIDLVDWCDNNQFVGHVRLSLQANNAVGLIVNSGSPTSNVGVYANHFTFLAVDAFAGLTGRVGVQLNHSKQSYILGLHVNPDAEGGAVRDNGSAESYYVVRTGKPGANARIDVLSKGISRAVAGMDGDVFIATDGAMTSGSATLTNATSAPWTRAMVGQPVVVAGAGAAGIPLASTISAYVSATQVTLAATASATVSGAETRSGTDCSAALQAVIDRYATYGGEVEIGPGAFALAATVTLREDCILRLAGGTILHWLGAAGGTVFTTDPTKPTVRTGLIGTRAQISLAGLADYCFDLVSPQFSVFGGFEVLDGRATTDVVRIRANASSTSTGYGGRRNASYNRVGPLRVKDPCGRVLNLDGTDPLGIITLNTFEDISAENVQVDGIRLETWCDNNVWVGDNRLQLLANNARGLVVNDSSTGSLNKVTVTAGGTGYTSAPTVGFSGGGGSGASAFATVSGGAVTNVYIINSGTGYTSGPTVTFTGGGGSGAAATAQPSGPTVDVGVYANAFGHLAIDTFAGFTGRVAVTMNKSKNTVISALFQDPSAEGGEIVGTNADSYWIMRTGAGGSAEHRIYQKGSYYPSGLFVTDANFGFELTGSDPLIRFDTADFIKFARSTNQYTFNFGASPMFTITTGGVIVAAGAVARHTGTAGNPAAAAVGDWWYNTTQRAHRFQNTAGVHGVVGLLKAQVSVAAGDTIGGNATTDFATLFAVPANGFNAIGKVVRVVASGVHSTGATPGTLTLQLRLGTKSLVTVGPLTLVASQTNKQWRVEFCVIVVTTSSGTNGVVEADGALDVNTTGTTYVRQLDTNTGTVTAVGLESAANLVITSTTTNANASITMRRLRVEVLD